MTRMCERVLRAARELGAEGAGLHEVAFRAGASHRQAMAHLRGAGWRMVQSARSDKGRAGMASVWVEG